MVLLLLLEVLAMVQELLVAPEAMVLVL